MRDEAREWFHLSRSDLQTAFQLRQDGIHYAAVFFAHQAAEKALKALWIERKAELAPRVHNLVVLASQLGADEEVLDAAAELSPEYVLTRYVTPEVASPPDLYDAASADVHLAASQRIVGWVRDGLGNEIE